MEDEPGDVFEKARREFERADAALKEALRPVAQQSGVDDLDQLADLFTKRILAPEAFEREWKRAHEQLTAVQAELAQIRGDKEQLKREAEQRNAALEGADPAGSSADRQRLQDALARLMKQRAGK